MQIFKPKSHISISSEQLPAVVPHYCHPRGARAFSRDFTTNLTSQGRAFTGALKIEKLKAPLFPGPRGAGVTNNWCIMQLCSISSIFTALSGVGSSPALATCETSQVLLAGVPGGFSRGSPVLAHLLFGPSHMS